MNNTAQNNLETIRFALASVSAVDNLLENMQKVLKQKENTNENAGTNFFNSTRIKGYEENSELVKKTKGVLDGAEKQLINRLPSSKQPTIETSTTKTVTTAPVRHGWQEVALSANKASSQAPAAKAVSMGPGS